MHSVTPNDTFEVREWSGRQSFVTEWNDGQRRTLHQPRGWSDTQRAEDLQYWQERLGAN